MHFIIFKKRIVTPGKIEKFPLDDFVNQQLKREHCTGPFRAEFLINP